MVYQPKSRSKSHDWAFCLGNLGFKPANDAEANIVSEHFKATLRTYVQDPLIRQLQEADNPMAFKEMVAEYLRRFGTV